MAQPKLSALFRRLELWQGERPWGRFLDAGTGVKSLQWICSLDTTGWTAVTASQGMAERIESELTFPPRAGDRLVVGNWIDPQLLAGERFDTVLLDYLIGAIEGFAPYWQEQVLHRVRPLVAGRLYIIGLDPYVPLPASDESSRLVIRIGRLRDACLLLADERPYREFPLEWVLDLLERSGFRTLEAERFPIRYHERFINGQLDMCLRRLPRLGSDDLAAAMRSQVEALRAEALDACRRLGGLRHGHDYVIAAEPV